MRDPTSELSIEAFDMNLRKVSLSLRQAMHLEVPVVARDIPGNAAVVQHEVTGLLYSTPQVRAP